MTEKERLINECFDKAIPHAIDLLYEIHMLQGKEIAKSTEELREHILKSTKPMKVDTTLFANVVNAYGNYYDFMKVLEDIKNNFPSDNVTALTESERGQKLFNNFKESISYIHNASPNEKNKEEFNKHMNYICGFIANTQSIYKEGLDS